MHPTRWDYPGIVNQYSEYVSEYHLPGVATEAAPRGAEASAAGMPDEEMLGPVPEELMAATWT